VLRFGLTFAAALALLIWTVWLQFREDRFYEDEHMPEGWKAE
jgi:hypothetical protein